MKNIEYFSQDEVENAASKIKEIIKPAIEYQKLTGRRVGITGEVGEILICYERKLKLVRSGINPGFDAKDAAGKKVQIKTRQVLLNQRMGLGRIGRFASDHDFDYLLFGILDDNFNIIHLYKCNRHPKLLKLIKAAPRGAPSIQSIINISDDWTEKFKRNQ